MTLEFEQLINQTKTPPEGYGIVPFYWWIGEPLSKERIKEQIEAMEGHSVSGLQINYAHSAEGGNQFGLTYESEPKLFSDEWWELFEWFTKECGKHNIKVSLSDYTLSGVGQGWYTDEILKKYPQMHGQKLILKEIHEMLEMPSMQSSNIRELERFCYAGKTYDVCVETVMTSINPIHPRTGQMVCRYFFDEFERRTGGKGGTDFDFFFSDELNFGIDGLLYHETIFEEFYKRKGYSIEGRLGNLFFDIDGICYKMRMDYHDVMVALEEERYFAPIYEWHEKRNMTYGCDHGSRGYDVTEFGSYFQTQKYNQAPGCDQPNLQSDIVKNKVASSIAHVNNRKRVWLEGFYGSGWGTTTEQLIDAIARNFVMGQNLLSLHGMYYTTYGGRWEWAPPCNCFRMPYWRDMKELTKAVERMSYLLSLGHHVCHVALYYPVEDKVCGFAESRAVEMSFEAARAIYADGIDFDFLDEAAILKAETEEGGIRIGMERYGIIVLPPMKIIREQLLKKLLQAAEKGVRIYILKSMPEMLETSEMSEKCYPDRLAKCCTLIENMSELICRLRQDTKKYLYIPGREKNVYTSIYAGMYTMHRRIPLPDGERGNVDVELFMIYGAKKGTVCTFGVGGVPYLWNPFTGECINIENAEKCSDGWKIPLPLSEKEIQIILFDTRDDIDIAEEICCTANQAYSASTDMRLVRKIPMDKWWDSYIMPVLDNRYGDFSQPPEKKCIGAQARSFWYYESKTDEMPVSFDEFIERAGAEKIPYGYGTKWLCAGPFSTDEEMERILHEGIMGNLSQYRPYELSERFGIYGDPGEQGYHGLKGKLSSDFLVVGTHHETLTGSVYREDEFGSGRIFYTNIRCEEAESVRILTGDLKPRMLYVDENPTDRRDILNLEKGYHSVFAVYDGYGRTHLVFEKQKPAQLHDMYPLAMKWYRNEMILPSDAYSGRKEEYGFFGFQAPPGLKELHFYINSKLNVCIDGKCHAILPSDDIEKPVKLILEKAISFSSYVIMMADYKETNGYYEGAVFEKPIDIICEKGRIQCGDWAKIDGLSSYSGTVAYERTVSIPELNRNEVCIFSCSEIVSTARMFWNGIYVGTKVCPPWEFDVTNYMTAGDNHIRLEVSNTLANQYETIPTRYRGNTKSGLTGDCEIKILTK